MSTHNDDHSSDNDTNDSTTHDDGGRVGGVLTLVLPLVAAAVARKAVAATWKASTGKNPPNAAHDAQTKASVLLIWGAATGAAVGAARVLAERQAGRLARGRDHSSTD